MKKVLTIELQSIILEKYSELLSMDLSERTLFNKRYVNIIWHMGLINPKVKRILTDYYTYVVESRREYLQEEYKSIKNPTGDNTIDRKAKEQIQQETFNDYRILLMNKLEQVIETGGVFTK